MAIKVEPENVEEMELRLPDQENGANSLILVTGSIPTNIAAGEESSVPWSNSYQFNAGPELEPSAIRSVRATASVISVYTSIVVPPAPPADGSAGLDGGDGRWALGEVDAVHDDDVRRARVTIGASTFARFGGFVRIERIGFELRILLRR